MGLWESDVWCQVDWISGNRVDCDIQHRYQEQCTYQGYDDMAQYIEIGRMFSPDESSESYISHYIEHDYGQRSDGTQEAEDLTRTEDYTDGSETNNLEDLLYMNGNIGCLVYRVNLSQSRRERSCL